MLDIYIAIKCISQSIYEISLNILKCFLKTILAADSATFHKADWSLYYHQKKRLHIIYRKVILAFADGQQILEL